MKYRVIGHFQIPDELAKELSEVLKESLIKKSLLITQIEDPSNFIITETEVITLENKIFELKNTISKKYVPTQYKLPGYTWNYEGYETATNFVQILI